MDDSHRSSDDGPSLLSYCPRAVGFDTKVPSRELGPQKNVSEETRTKITQKNFRGGGLIASIARVCYGTFKQKKAIIMVIRLLFHCSVDIRQLQHLEVQVLFEPQTETAAVPVVCNLSPGKIHGVLNTDGPTWSYRTEQQCSSSKVIYSTNSAIGNNVQSSSENIPRLIIKGVPWSDSRYGDSHMACWDIRAKGKPIVGIPDDINLAVAVTCEEAFRAVVKIGLNLPLYEKILAVPWSKDDPILFPVKEPGFCIGGGLKTTQFETLSDADWAALISGSEVSSKINSFLGFDHDYIDTSSRSQALRRLRWPQRALEYFEYKEFRLSLTETPSQG